MHDPQLELSSTDILLAASDLVLPRVCVVCGRPLVMNEHHLCLCCEADLPETHFWAFPHNPMADAYNARIAETAERFEPYQYACSLFYYHRDSPYDRLPQAVKYRRHFSAGKLLASMMAHRLVQAEWFADVDLVVPVPLHWFRKAKRGYNQAAVVGAALAKRMGVRYCAGLLKRKRRTVTQTRLSAEQKRLNVKGAFRARRSAATRLAGSVRHILLVDDVFTSGSTLCACHDELRTIFPQDTRISIATISYVEN